MSLSTRFPHPSALLATLAFLLTAASTVFGQNVVLPLQENSWDNPTFVNRFVGTYGALAPVEPQISEEEAVLFQELTTLLQSDQFAAATQQLAAAVTPESSAALDFTLGSLYLQAGDFRRAIASYETAVEKHPNFLRAYKNLGLAYLQNGDYEGAVSYIVQAIELGDKDGNAFGLLAYCYLNTGRTESALNAYRMASVLSPDNIDWRIGKATALQQSGQNEESIAAFLELIDEFPDRDAYYTVIANAYLDMGDEDQTASYLEAMRRMGIASPDVLMLLGDIYLNTNLEDIGAEVYLEVLQNGERINQERVSRFTRALVQRGSYESARALIVGLRQSVGARLDDEVQDSLLSMESQMALAENNSDEAVAILETLVERNPRNGEALMLLARFAQDEDDAATAAYYYDRVIAIPDYEYRGLIQKARLAVNVESDLPEAIELLERALGIRRTENVERYLEAIRRVQRQREL